MPKNGLLGLFWEQIPKIAKRLDSMARECARPYSQWTCLVDADARQFEAKL